MPIDLQNEGGNILRIELRGTLRQEEFAHCQQQVLHEVSRVGPVRLLFTLEGFEGWDSQDNWHDLGFFVRHGDAIERIAIVGDERWRDLALMFAAADLRNAPVEYFGAQDLASAHTWLTHK
jgi:hypothetical protein